MIKLYDDLPIIEQLVGESIANSVSPGEYFYRSSLVNSGTYLEHQGIFSNRTGALFSQNNGRIIEVWVANKEISTFTIRFTHHLGNSLNETFLQDIPVVSSRSVQFTTLDFGEVLVPKNVQIAAYLLSGTARDLKVQMFLGGTP